MIRPVLRTPMINQMRKIATRIPINLEAIKEILKRTMPEKKTRMKKK